MTSLKISILPLVLGVAVSNVAMAQTDCSTYGDNYQRIEKTVEERIHPNTIPFHYVHWSNARTIEFDFGYASITAIEDLEFKIHIRNSGDTMAAPGRLTFVVKDSPTSYMDDYVEVTSTAQNTYTATDLSSVYDNELKHGRLNLGLLYAYHPDLGEPNDISVESARVSFCGVVKDDTTANDDSQKLDAARNNLLTEQGEAVQHYLDANITYRATVTGAATDQNGNAISSVSVNYIDPRLQKNITKQLSDNQEYYLHSDGKVSLYYTNGNEHNTGGHTVTFERVNLD